MWAVETVAPPRLRWMEGNVRECEGTREGMLARLGERDFEVQRHIPPGSPHSPFTHSPFTTFTTFATFWHDVDTGIDYQFIHKKIRSWETKSGHWPS
jgi:hypothetical protein